MEEGKIVRWLKREGERITMGEELLEVETEKVNVALEATGSGILRKILYAEGSTVNVGTAIGIIAEPNEDIQSVLNEVSQSTVPELTAPKNQQALTSTTPRPATDNQGVGEVVASPRARRLAREKGIDLMKIKGSGPAGRIVEEDIMELVELQPERSLPFTVSNTIPITGLRKLTADRMLSSLQTKAQITITAEVDMTSVKSLREDLNRRSKELPKITYNDLIVRAVGITLGQHRILNSFTLENEVKIVDEINIGLAVDVEGGLVVPVIRNVDKLSLLEISRKTSDLVTRALSGKLDITDVSDGTFTVTNLGMYEIDVNTAIINPPQNAVLAIGRIVQKPVVLDNQILARDMMTLSLTFDHRAIDGAPVAKFLRDLKKTLEDKIESLT